MDRNFGHIMVDIETMGNKSHSAIVSIGAVEFDLNTGQTGRTFYTNISLQSCLDAGLRINGDTLMWWMKQDDEARKSLTSGEQAVLAKALYDFSVFIASCGGKDCQVWGNSARFDLGILSDAYDAVSLPLPWDFYKERCVRTLVSFAPEIKKSTAFDGVAHDALADCYHQIKYCTQTWKVLNEIKTS